ncbi:MAG: 50S ribosomal protein L32, partial [Candidatus Thiodiazotropha taylori]|nr:50S ribosomal protein L32 [Candidatus Thiodiazotropha taylori]MCW4326569.1 50S ribosomal protein L32 [Candidatus Thiodiazotropha taylori]
MAVQQNKKTPSKRGMRRAHDGLKSETLSIDSTS